MTRINGTKAAPPARKGRKRKTKKLFAILEFIQMVAADSVEEVRARLPEGRRFKVEEMK